MTGGLGVGAIVTLAADARSDWWVVLGKEDIPGVGRLLSLSRWLPDSWVQVRPGEWWEYTEVDTARQALTLSVTGVVFPAVTPWPLGVA